MLYFPPLNCIVGAFFQVGAYTSRNRWLSWWNGACTSFHRHFLLHDRIKDQSYTLPQLHKPSLIILILSSNLEHHPLNLSLSTSTFIGYISAGLTLLPSFSANVSIIFRLVLVLDRWTCCSSSANEWKTCNNQPMVHYYNNRLDVAMSLGW